jgi:hypothetical protein
MLNPIAIAILNDTYFIVNVGLQRGLVIYL